MSKVIKNDDKKQIWLLKNTKWVWLYLWIEDLWCRRVCACACASKCLRCTMLCRTVLVRCHAMPFHAVPCCAVLCGMVVCMHVEWRVWYRLKWNKWSFYSVYTSCIAYMIYNQNDIWCIGDDATAEIFWQRSGHTESVQRSQL